MKRAVLAAVTCSVLLRASTFDQVLARSAKAAEQEVVFLSSVTCTETVSEAKLNAKDKTEALRKRQFDYFVMVDASDGDLSVNESRIEQSAAKKDAKTLLDSSGFGLMMLIFHPFYQRSFEFADQGAETSGGTECRRIAFRYVPGKRSPTLLKAGSREYPLAWSGEAIVEARTGRVRNIHASVAAQLDEIGLKALEVAVEYGVPPKLNAATDWAPLKADVDLRTARQHWHNAHTFESFRKFEVDTTERVVSKPQ